MKTIKSLKDITTLEVDDVVVFGELKYKVRKSFSLSHYYLHCCHQYPNNEIFTYLQLNALSFCDNLGICICNATQIQAGSDSFPEVKTLEALTAVAAALLKEYEKQNFLPKTWEEFCKRNPVTPDEYWIETVYSRYCNSSRNRNRDKDQDKNVCISLQEAKAHTALMQLRQLRKCYVGDWEPTWNCTRDNYCIIVCQQKVVICPRSIVSHTLSFPTSELAEQFLTNFKDLLEIAKPLL